MLRKTLSLNDCEIKLAADTGRFSGYASTFGGVDQGGDTILKGAYTKTLESHGVPQMYLQHDSNELPIGKWVTIKEDDRGLMVEGEFTPGMARAADARAALKHGTVNGLSIGYMLKADDYDDTDSGRVIRSVSMLREISIVTYPMDLDARIDLASVKSDIEGLETLRDYERFLRDAGGVSKAVASALANRAKIICSRRDADEENIDAKAIAEFSAVLKRFTVPKTLIR